MIAAIEQLHSDLADLAVRLAEAERRIANGVMHGTVTDVDTAKGRARLRIGGSDAEPQKSPWLPYAQVAGMGQGTDTDDFKFHHPPVVGQQMTMLAPAGEWRQALLLPFTWSDQATSPASGADPVLKLGKLVITHQKARYNIKLGDAEVEIADGAITVTKGATVMTLTGDKATIKAATIVLDGLVKLGGEEANRPASAEGTLDTANDADVANFATRVLVM